MIENDRRKYHQGSREILENCFSINSSSKVLSYFDVEPSNGNYQRNYRRVLYRRLPSTNTIGPHPRRTAFTCRTNTSTKFARREPICRSRTAQLLWSCQVQRSKRMLRSGSATCAIIQIRWSGRRHIITNLLIRRLLWNKRLSINNLIHRSDSIPKKILLIL